MFLKAEDQKKEKYCVFICYLKTIRDLSLSMLTNLDSTEAVCKNKRRIQMKRKLLSPEELESWLTVELRKFKGCKSCEVIGVDGLLEPDKTGCNWSSLVTVRVTGVPRDVFEPPVKDVVEQAQAKFNLK